jgi:hypothetical protein
MSVATSLLTACSGFLFAVLWMDLMFDAQVLADRRSRGDLPESVLASIAGYYRRAVTGSRPMSRLIAVVMVVLLGALGIGSARGRPGAAGTDAHGSQRGPARQPFGQPDRPNRAGAVHLA